MDDLQERADRAGATPGAPYLCRWSPDGTAQQWSLRPPGMIVGRSAEADVVLDADPLVSRVHARLELIAGLWTIADDGLSRNGTLVNGRPVTGRVALRDRDEIRIGGTVLSYCSPAEVVAAQTQASGPFLTAAQVTPAQRAVLVALCRPYGSGQPYASPATNPQIAAELSLSVDAVKTHLRALFHRLDIDHLPQNSKRVCLAELALRSGIVPRHELTRTPAART